MKKPFPLRLRILRVALFAAAVSVGASKADKLALNPEQGILWKLPLGEFPTGETSSAEFWKATPGITGVAGSGGLEMAATNNPAGAIGRYLSVSPKFPYLVFEISSVSTQKGYIQSVMVFDTPAGSGQKRSLVGGLPEGRYVTRFDFDAEKPVWFRWNLSGVSFKLGKFELAENPLPRMDVVSENPGGEAPRRGDKIRITVRLAQPANDVTVELINSYILSTIPVDGESSVQLTPVADSGKKVWEATIAIPDIKSKNFPAGQPIPGGQILFRANVLGGGIEVPVMTWNSFPIKP